MGWADCGTDSKGRPIGYAFEATCDHPGCDTKINRGLSYACGNMHGNTDWGCENYFCPEHLMLVDKDHDSQLCFACHDHMQAHEAEEAEWQEAEDLEDGPNYGRLIKDDCKIGDSREK